jgi:DNA polymerase-3 subunit alpha
MAFLTLEDLSGFAEVTLFSSVYSKAANLVEKGSAIFVEGRVTKDENSAKILGDAVIPIEKAEELWTTSVRLDLDMTTLDKEMLQQLYDLLTRHKGTSNAYLHLRIPRKTETIIALPDHIRVKAGRELTEAINDFLGYSAVQTVCQTTTHS